MRATKTLSEKEVLFFFTVACLVYVFPIIHADYTYVDDNWRALLWADDGWREQGRVLLEVVTKFLAFNNATINIFPLPLLIATFTVAYAMSRLTLWYFPRPEWTACLVVLPMLCNPFFLGNITYQYDGPGMMFAVAAAILAITCNIKNNYLRQGVSAVLVAVVLGLYQLVITVFIGLCFVECLWNVRNGSPARDALTDMARRGLQLFIGGVIYYFTAYQMKVSSRGLINIFSGQWLGEVGRKFVFSMERMSDLINSGNMALSVLIVVAAGAGYLRLVMKVSALKGGRLEKNLILIATLCVIPGLLVGIPGAMLFMAERNLFARNYVGFSVVLFFLFLLGYEFLGSIWYRLRLFLIVPVLCMYSFCYAYGQVIVAKKELETAMATFVAYDLGATKEFWQADVIYYIGPRINGNWLPKGYHAMSYMPTLRYILSDANVLLHSHFLPRQGANNVVDGERAAFDAATSPGKKFSQVVDRKFYSFYITEAGSFIVMKDITDPEKYFEDPW